MEARTIESIRAGELADRLGGFVLGDADRLVRGVGTLQDAGPDDLAWLSQARLLNELRHSRAAVVLIPRDLPDELLSSSAAAPAGLAGDSAPPAEVLLERTSSGQPGPAGPVCGRTFIRVADPELAICDVLRWMSPAPERVPPGVHPAACVHPTATVAGAAIAAGVTVGPGAVVGPGTQLHSGVFIGELARIGHDCVLWPNVVILARVVLGNRVTIQPNSTIGADGFGYLLRDGRHVKVPQVGSVQIDDDVEIGANSCIDRARSGWTRIGQGTKIDNLVQIGHNVVIGRHCILVGQAGVSGSCVLGDYVTLAGQAGVADHVHLGDRSAVTAKSGVAGDVAAGAVVRGTPARDVATFNRAYAALLRLPRLVEQLRELTRRVQELESATNDSARA